MKQLKMFGNKVKYSIDTSAILNGYNRYYPPDVFPTLWEKIESLIKNGDLKATEMVLEELKRKKDDAYKWAKQQEKGLFAPVDEDVKSIVSTIRKDYYDTKDEKNSKEDMADPFVIALAKKHGATVISGEKPQPQGKKKNPTIPLICKNLRVKYINFLELIRTEQWSF